MARATRSKPKQTRNLKSLKVSDGFKAFVLDQLEDVGDVTPQSPLCQ